MVARVLDGRPNAGLAGVNGRAEVLTEVDGGTATGEKLNAEAAAADRTTAQAAEWNFMVQLFFFSIW
jgi:hypothetical protein